jgi:hypothetical protein
LLKTLLVVACLATTMLAQNTNPNRLKGDFPFNETLQIIIGGTQGGSCPNVLTGPVSQSTLTNTGIWSFDGKGNVSIVDQGMLVQIPSTDASQVTPSNAVCTGTYALLDADTVDFHYNCSTVPGTYFQVHTTGKITPNNILVAVYHRPDGSLDVAPFYAGNTIVACTYVAENTVISRTGNGQ